MRPCLLAHTPFVCVARVTRLHYDTQFCCFAAACVSEHLQHDVHEMLRSATHILDLLENSCAVHTHPLHAHT
jgi:hypothetical protein